MTTVVYKARDARQSREYNVPSKRGKKERKQRGKSDVDHRVSISRKTSAMNAGRGEAGGRQASRPRCKVPKGQGQPRPASHAAPTTERPSDQHRAASPSEFPRRSFLLHR
ncbi:hypothetical protein HPB47_025346 [Ixodes persulcatus]|uniref:Uncharacterized protein n=1 Tax=Ixodes persulcatus TaxID=34615 RepID=A0AC60Q2A0_IXOPE|nr:hypothetical protein HPB47_025346 [Ixodes persulcatus]